MKSTSPFRRAASRASLRMASVATSALLLFPAAALAQNPTTPPPAPTESTPAPTADPAIPPPITKVSPNSLPTPISKRQLQEADNAYLAGARLLDRHDLAAAETQFAKAKQLNPGNPDYALALIVAREHRVTELVQKAGKARLLGQTAAADTILAQARALDPENAIVLQHFDPSPPTASFTPTLAGSDLAKANLDEPLNPDTIGKSNLSFAGVITLLPTKAPKSFHYHSDVRQVVSQISVAYGIRSVFDASVAPQNMRFDLDDTTYAQVMPIVLQMGGLFAVPLDPHSILIAKDTPDNRQRLERQIEETIYLPALAPDQMSELLNVVRNIFDLKQVTIQNSAGAMVVRAPESVLSALNLTLADLVDGGSQVVIDLKLYSLDKTHSTNIGAQLPQQFGIYNVESAATTLVNANQTLVNQAIAQGLIPAGSSNIAIALALIASGLVQSAMLSSTIGFFGGGLTATGVTSNVNPTFNLALNSSDTRALEDIQLRVGDHQSATFRVGSRYPITTSTFSFQSSAATSALSGVTVNGVPAASLLNQILGNASSTTIPQIQYEDLGITLKATPIVQKTNNITVHIDLKIEALTGTALNNIPLLTSRQFISDLTIADGQTALLISSLSKTESGAVSGYPGLAELPGFQSTISNTTTDQTSSDLVLLITPRIVRRRSSIIAGPRIALNMPHSD
jgi:general secretion pathway protein D